MVFPADRMPLAFRLHEISIARLQQRYSREPVVAMLRENPSMLQTTSLGALMQYNDSLRRAPAKLIDDSHLPMSPRILVGTRRPRHLYRSVRGFHSTRVCRPYRVADT